MKGVREANDMLPAGNLPRELQGRFHGVCSRRTGEHDFIVQSPWPEDEIVECFEEAPLGRGLHIEGVDDRAGEKILHQRAQQHRVVVSVVESSGAGKEIQIFPAIFTEEAAAGRTLKHGVPAAAIAADLRFHSFEDIHR